MPSAQLVVPLGPARFVLGAIWLLVVPLLTWGVRVLYVPLLGAALDGRVAWLAAGTIVGGAMVCLLLHGCAHAVVARALGAELPERLSLYPLGDAAQVWPAAGNATAEAAVAVAGPAGSALLAVIAFAVWNAQPATFTNVVTLFLALLNSGLALLNLAPAFPFDGGRLLRALVWQLLRRPALGTRLAYRLGLLLLLLLVVWSGFLAWQRLRFSLETSLATLIVMALVAVALFGRRTRRWERPEQTARRQPALRFAAGALIGTYALVMAGAVALILPLNSGLEAPGSAESIEPMLHVPPERAHHAAGTFMLTTVVPQAPILVGEWLYAHEDHAIHLTAAQTIVPAGTTPQQEAVAGFHDLQDSVQTAIVAGLNLAGYPATLPFEGAEIVGMLPESKAGGVLRAGDVITSVNGTRVDSVSAVAQILAAAPAASMAGVTFKRGGQTLSQTVALLPPVAGSTTPRIGISLAPVIGAPTLPFPVTLTPRKVEGGSSAGLMFSLTVFNALTPGDLTGGHRIAGTGTIDLSGNVGPIDGVQQKVFAAEGAGAEYFLCPPENYAQAAAVAKHVKVVQVSSADEAVAFLKTLPPARQW